MTVFCPLTTNGKFVIQVPDARFVVDCNENPMKLVGRSNNTVAVVEI
jgi:hypothetical protein